MLFCTKQTRTVGNCSDPSNQLFSTVGRPISRSPRVCATVNISWTWPPGLTYAPRGPSTDMLNMSFFWVMTETQRRQQNTVHCNKRWTYARFTTMNTAVTSKLHFYQTLLVQVAQSVVVVSVFCLPVSPDNNFLTTWHLTDIWHTALPWHCH